MRRSWKNAGYWTFCCVCIVVAGCLPASGAFAQSAQPVELTGNVMLERTVNDGGQERRVLQSPDTVVPGDLLVFSTNYRNTGGETVKDFVVTNPVPEAIRIGAQDAQSLELSVDGGTAWGKLADLQVSDDKGGMRPAGVDDVTHIRWVFATLEPGAKGTVTYRGTVR